jgi:hypothetical protein
MFRGVMNEFVYEWDEVVIGNNLPATIYAYLNSVPIIPNSPRRHNFFEFLSPDLNLERLSIKNESKKLSGFKEDRLVGISKFEVYKKLTFLNSLAGLNPLCDKVATIRIENGYVKVTTQNFGLIRIKFNKLRIFDDENVTGLEEPPGLKDKFKVLDWVNVKSGMTHDYDILKSSIDFVREIYFYPSKRIDGSTNRKDLVSVSYLTEEQLGDFDFSDTVAKFKILKLMKRAGIKGARNGRDANDPNKYKYYSLNIRPIKREVMKRSLPKYKNCDNIIFDDREIRELLEDDGSTNRYLDRVRQAIF